VRHVVDRHNVRRPLQVVTRTTTQSFQPGGRNTLLVCWTLTSVLYINRLLDIDVPVKHTSVRRIIFLPQQVFDLSTSAWGHAWPVWWTSC